MMAINEGKKSGKRNRERKKERKRAGTFSFNFWKGAEKGES
jgi:hypothetical protein